MLCPGCSKELEDDCEFCPFCGIATVQGQSLYERLANSKTPALVIYLLDISASMGTPLGGKQRIDVVMDSLEIILKQMIFRSTKGSVIMPRYRVAMFAYSDKVYDLLDGIKTIEEVVQYGVPDLSPLRTTETAQAFMACEDLLINEIPNLVDCPAPLVCHLTDGEYTGDDPEPIARRIMSMKVPDGNVLVENIFISDNILEDEIKDPQLWAGITPTTVFANNYATKLQGMSSLIPPSYQVCTAPGFLDTTLHHA